MSIVRINSLGITDGTIVNGDINASAGITLAKLSGVNDAKAWVNFNGTGTVAIRGSFNVTSITDNGIGSYTINLTTAMPDANYAPVLGHGYARDLTGYTYGVCFAETASTIRINIAEDGNGERDTSQVTVAIFR